MKTKKQIFQTRIRRIVVHRDNPTAPVDAATLLHVESQRLAEIGHPLAKRMAGAMKLAASKLECWGDPACMVRFQKFLRRTPKSTRPQETKTNNVELPTTTYMSESSNTPETPANERLTSRDLFCRKWNFENRGGEIWVCKGDHEGECRKSDHEELFAEDAINLIETLRSMILRQNAGGDAPGANGKPMT